MQRAVSRITQAGDYVIFWKGTDDNFVQSRRTRQKTKLHKEGNVYVMYVLVTEDDIFRWVKSVIDSGAAEHVMPRHW